MSLPDQTPKLPKLPFLAGDALLLGIAWYIAYQANGPLSTNAVFVVAGCVALACILGAIPFLADYARKQDEALDDRQRGLDALARTTSTAAEQISIAANGLNELTDLLHRNLKHAEQLPHKLQEKIAEFNAQLDNTREDEREALEKEIAELQASETERLQTIADRVHKSVAELTKLEAAAQKQLAERNDLLAKAQAAVDQARDRSTQALQGAAEAVARELTSAKTAALAEIESKLAAASKTAIAAVEAAVAAAADSAAARLTAAAVPIPAPVPPPAPEPASDASELAAPPKRPRKSRREESAAAETAQPEPGAPAEPAEATPPVEQPSSPATESDQTADSPSSEPASPAAPPPSTSPTESDHSAAAEPAEVKAQSPEQAPSPPPPAAAPEASETAPAQPERPARKKNRRAAAESNDLTLELGGGEFASPANDDTPVTSAEVIERVISSDGATRLIATAYIGIGNRLFIRGEGPGLSWEKGVPLQFVSIGKWRWETSDASAPIRAKLYKNDDIECTALGTLTLEPGHQQEVTAKF